MRQDVDYHGWDHAAWEQTIRPGIAEIMTMAAYFLGHPEVKHGTICIGFTPDEEVGSGADLFDLDYFKARFAYTVDGDYEAKLPMKTSMRKCFF